MWRLLLNLLLSMSVLSFLAACGKEEGSSARNISGNDSAREAVIEQPTGIFSSPFASTTHIGTSREETSNQGKTLAGITSLWDRNAPSRLSTSAGEEESQESPVQIISATEFRNPLPPIRVVHPSLAGRISSPLKPTASRSGDQVEKRNVDQRPGDAVVRRQGDIK